MLLVTGAGGFLGRYVVRELVAAGRPVVAAVYKNSSDDLGPNVLRADLSSPSGAMDVVLQVRPECVVNCAAFTDVDACEREPDKAERLNSGIPRALAIACARAGAQLVHISTDSVFDGRRGHYSEDDEPAPVNAYARSKLSGEEAVRENLPGALLLRTNFIGPSHSGRTGLADWIAGRLEAGERITGFTDVVFSPLLVNDLARLIIASIDARLEGLWHASAEDALSKYDFARRIAVALGHDESLVDAATLADAKLAAPRPLDTSLSSSRLAEALGRPMPRVDDAIAGYTAAHTARLSLNRA